MLNSLAASRARATASLETVVTPSSSSSGRRINADERVCVIDIGADVGVENHRRRIRERRYQEQQQQSDTHCG